MQDLSTWADDVLSKAKDKGAKMSAQDWISAKIKELRKEGRPQKQAVAMAMAMAREKGYSVPAEKAGLGAWADDVLQKAQSDADKAIFIAELRKYVRRVVAGKDPKALADAAARDACCRKACDMAIAQLAEEDETAMPLQRYLSAAKGDGMMEDCREAMAQVLADAKALADAEKAPEAGPQDGKPSSMYGAQGGAWSQINGYGMGGYMGDGPVAVND